MSTTRFLNVLKSNARLWRSTAVPFRQTFHNNRRMPKMQSPHFVQRASLSQTTIPKTYTINPYTEAKSSIKTQAKLIGKIVGYTTLSVSAAVALIWQMSHWYIEYFVESTPPELGYQGRNLLHGAYIRETWAPDYQLATVYVREALRIALEEKHLDETSKTIIDLRLRLGNDEAHAGNLLDAIAEYTRSWKLLLDKQDISNRTIETAQHIGELYLRIGDFVRAEEFLAWALHQVSLPSSSSSTSSVAATVEGQNQDNQNTKDKKTTLKAKITLTLGSLYALQKNYDLALPLLTQSLQLVPEDSVCLKAIVQNQLSEVLFALGKVQDAMGWAQAALNTSATKAQEQDCIECGGVAANNLGSILELKGDFEQALAYYNQAIQYGSAIYDSDSQTRYTVNMERVKEKLDSDVVKSKESV